MTEISEWLNSNDNTVDQCDVCKKHYNCIWMIDGRKLCQTCLRKELKKK